LLLESGGGGVADPLLDESGGGLVVDGLLDGLLWSEGGALDCMEFEESAGGEEGAVEVESVLGELGDVDCCLEQAETTARALRHNNRALRFIKSPHYG
jgi:hypothetical protein